MPAKLRSASVQTKQPRRSRGRPRLYDMRMTLCLSNADAATLDKWIALNAPGASRQQAITEIIRAAARPPRVPIDVDKDMSEQWSNWHNIKTLADMIP